MLWTLEQGRRLDLALSAWKTWCQTVIQSISKQWTENFRVSTPKKVDLWVPVCLTKEEIWVFSPIHAQRPSRPEADPVSTQSYDPAHLSSFAGDCSRLLQTCCFFQRNDDASVLFLVYSSMLVYWCSMNRKMLHILWPINLHSKELSESKFVPNHEGGNCCQICADPTTAVFKWVLNQK